MDGELIRAIILGIVQGITEFLPISSDGHLVVVQTLLRACGIAATTAPAGAPHVSDLQFDVVLHIGTLAAILVVYRSDLWELRKQPRLCGLLVLATLPAVVAGLTLKDSIEKAFNSPLMAGLGFLVTAGCLYFASRCPPGVRTIQDLTARDSLLIGLAQATAILPGVSRSGTTISTGIGVGLRRDLSATWSFLMAVPVVAGAIVLILKDMLKQPATITRPDTLIVGTLVSFVVGLIALRWLIRVLARGGLRGFALYCLIAGIAVTGWQLIAPSPTTPDHNATVPAPRSPS